ncbi:hypothetical protein L596_027330 [Steinernema carpocapsae]|uniref:Uncharacterized protein n=1 Tax=Steinernema carpocapsae TaxID=34508 RepID=A0A4U5M464_STECR|nr:hypothetical protein L596_027330 [Steinernema carpocapsae]
MDSITTSILGYCSTLTSVFIANPKTFGLPRTPTHRPRRNALVDCRDGFQVIPHSYETGKYLIRDRERSK